MQIKRKGITLIVNEDYDYDDNPRERENLGKMVCFHRNYRLGDEHQFEDPDDFKEWLETNKNNVATYLPLYLLDHSGLAISIFDYHDRWDSGQVGYIYCTKDDVKKFGYEKLNKLELNAKLEHEVREYDSYLQGEKQYFYFNLTDEDDNCIDCVGGFELSNLTDMLKEMAEYVDDKYHFLFDTLAKRENENYL